MIVLHLSIKMKNGEKTMEIEERRREKIWRSAPSEFKDEEHYADFKDDDRMSYRMAGDIPNTSSTRE